MAITSVAVIQATFKTFYVNESVDDFVAFNLEHNVLKIIDKSSIVAKGNDWSISIKSKLGGGGEFVAEGGPVPAAGTPGFLKITGGTQEFVMPRQVTTKVMNESDEAQLWQAIGGLVKDIKDSWEQAVDFYALCGGRVKGFSNERKVYTPSTNALLVGGPAGVAVTNGVNMILQAEVVYGRTSNDGTKIDSNPFNAILAASIPTWVRIRLFDAGTGLEILPAGVGATAANRGIFVTACDANAQGGSASKTAATITVQVVSNNSQVATLDATVVTPPNGVIIALHDTQFLDVAGVAFGTIIDFAKEFIGIMGNVADPTWFNVNRADGSPDAANTVPFRGNVITMNTAASGARVAINGQQLQAALEIIEDRVGPGEMPDALVVNNRSLSAYQAVITTTAQYNTLSLEGGKKVDIAPKASQLQVLGYNPILSKNVPKSTFMFLQQKTWRFLKTKTAGFMLGADGNQPLMWNVNTMSYSMIWTAQFGIICCQPQSQMFLIGFNI